MFIKRIKIGISLILSFLLSTIIIHFTITPEEPTFDTEKIKTTVLSAISTVPNFFTLFPQLQPSLTKPANQTTPKINKPISFNNNGVIAPTNNSQKPTVLFPTIKKPVIKTPTPYKNPPARPTLKPTVKPSPIPPSPTEQPIGTQRPGTNLDETLKIISVKTCVPSALFKAIGQNESGGRLSKLTQNEFVLFNRYDWWNEKTTNLNQVCYGIAYNHHTGLVPAGAQYANQRCMKAETFSTDIFSMGFMSISQWEEDSYRERVKKIMKTDKIDRRVIFDTLMIAGLHYKNISTYRGDDCENWEGKYIAKAACKYLGRCHYDWGGRAGDYCQDICNYYNQFTTGKKADCNNVSSRYFENNGDDGKCTLKM